MPKRAVYLISPADCSGHRAALLLKGGGNREIAAGLRSRAGVPIGNLFSFVSGSYFRGKLLYAKAFATSSASGGGVYVIVPGRGLGVPEAHIRLADLREIAAVPVHRDVDRYVKPLLKDAKRLARRLSKHDAVVFLGSIASDKYTSVLHTAFENLLHVPRAFIGRGSLSRGSLLLRAAKAGQRLAYVRVEEIVGLRR